MLGSLVEVSGLEKFPIGATVRPVWLKFESSTDGLSVIKTSVGKLKGLSVAGDPRSPCLGVTPVSKAPGVDENVAGADVMPKDDPKNCSVDEPGAE